MLGFVDVILRVPPIFIIDEILKISMGLPFTTQNDSNILDSSQMSIIDTTTKAAASSAAASSSADNILFNGNNNGTISSSNFSSSNSSLEQFLNTSAELFGDAMSAAAADDTEFYKLISLTSLKFLTCLLGKCVALSIYMRLIQFDSVAIAKVQIERLSEISCLSRRNQFCGCFAHYFRIECINLMSLLR